MSKKDSGFTLIELMVAVTIITILFMVGMAYYANFLKNSRDAKRQSDLKFIQSAMEAYHADKLSYPPDLNSLTSGAKVYMTKLPNDPKAPQAPDYSYVPSPSGCSSQCTTYCLYAYLEGTVPNSDSVCNLLPAGYKYGVTRP